MIAWMRKGGGDSVLGLSLEAGRLEAVAVRRVDGRVEIRQRCEAALSLDLLGGDPQLVGREIRKHLDEAGIRDRNCVVCVPLAWALVLQVRLPDLPAADLADFLQLEAERGFPYSPEALVIARSRFRTPAGEDFVTLIAIPRDHVTRLEAVLTAAQLRPETFSLGVSALQSAADEGAKAVLALVPRGRAVQLQVTVGGGVAVLRTMEGAYEGEAATGELEGENLVRELRITLGQLPSGVRDALETIRVFGRGEPAEELAEALETAATAWRLRIERVTGYSPGAFPVAVPDGLAVSAAFSLAVRRLTNQATDGDFLPPRVSSWRRFAERYSSRKVFWTGATASAVALVVILAFLVQQILLWRWESRWKGMSARVSELDSIQQKIRRYRPWFDESQRTLGMLRRLTEAFPEDGAVSAKSVEIRAGTTVVCSGIARDRKALMRALDRLGAFSEVGDVKLERAQARGQAPLEFTFNFKWTDASTP